jgi:hypothetical protein
MQRLDIAQFQQQMHLIEVLLDDIEQGKEPARSVHQGRCHLQRPARQDHPTATRHPRRGRHHDGRRASALHRRALPQDRRSVAPVGREPGAPAIGAGNWRRSAARHPAVRAGAGAGGRSAALHREPARRGNDDVGSAPTTIGRGRRAPSSGRWTSSTPEGCSPHRPSTTTCREWRRNSRRKARSSARIRENSCA